MELFAIGEETVLQFIDEYTLYCHYLEFDPEIQVNYLSPIRPDDDSPSFGLYPVKRSITEFMWKDSGGMGDSGNIFKLVKLLYGYATTLEAIARIKSDFGLGLLLPPATKVVRKRPVQRSDIDIRVRAREFRQDDLSFWNQFNINKVTLEKHRVSPLYCYWMVNGQKAPYFAPASAYVYREYDKYQLYFPKNEKGRKFRNDLQSHHVMGMQQLAYKSDTLIITKSKKDVMCLDSYGYEAVSPRSENTPMPDGFFDWADAHYKHKLVLFDNDMKHRGEWYPYPKIYVPEEPGVKDISDFTCKHSPHAAAELLSSITNVW